MIKKSSKAKLEDEIISYYKAHSNKKPTFDKMYKSWRSVQDHLVGDNTIYKYQTDYKRFFEDSEFAAQEIEKISEDDLKIFSMTVLFPTNWVKGHLRNYLDM